MNPPDTTPLSARLGKGSTPRRIDPKQYPALEELRQHCHKGGLALIDRAYDEVVLLHLRAKEAEDLAGLTEPAPPLPKRVYGGKLAENVVQRAVVEIISHDYPLKDEEML